MVRRGAALAALLVALTTALAPAVARADPASDARFFDQRGRKFFLAGRFADALQAFFLSQSVSRTARLPYNIAVCAERIGELWLAFTYYRAYLQGGDDDPERRANAEARLEALGERLALVAATSEPEGATVFVDAARFGAYGATPLVFPVEPGPHLLRLSHEGHEDARVEVYARPGEVQEVDVTLAPTLGSLEVEGRPEGGRIFVLRGGEVVADGGDTLAVRLPVGLYRVRYERTGHQPAERDAEVTALRTERLVLAAVPSPEASARLLVTAGDLTAEVWVDGRRVAQTPAVVPRLRPGRHRVVVRAAGHRPHEAEVELVRGEPFLLRVALTPE